MFKKILFLFLFLIISKDAFSGPPPFCYQEEDGSPSGCYKKIKFANGSLTLNGDGTFSHSQSGVGGGDSVSIDSVAVTDPDFVSTGQVDFVDTSNTVTANINDNSILEADLKAVDASADEDILTYESTTGDFEWHSAADLEAAFEAVLDLQDLQGAVTDAQVPNNITVDLATTVTTNANLTGEVTSVGNAATIADSVSVTSWNLTTPTITTSLTANALTISAAELGYLDTVSSNIQTQLNAKLALAGGTLTGEVTVDDLGLEFTPGDTLTDCSTYSATGGGIFYDDSEGKFKKCQDNTLTDLDTGGSETNSLEVLTTGIATTEIPIGTAANTVVYAPLSGDVTMANTGAVTIGNDKILESMLKAVDAAGDEECLTYETTTGDFEWQACGSGSGSTAINLPVYSAKLTGAYVVFTPPTADACSQSASIGAGDGNWRLLFDATTDECATWQFVIPDNYSSTPTLKIKYSMTSATTNEVEFEAAIMCVTPGDSADIGTASFSNVAVCSDTVPGTVGYLDTCTITLTDDSCAAGDVAFVVLSKDADDATNDDATGDTEVVGIEFDYA